MVIIIISGNNHCYTVIVVHFTGPRAIPQRHGSWSGTGSGAPESTGPVTDCEILPTRKGSRDVGAQPHQTTTERLAS